jgi:hypothetical protein
MSYKSNSNKESEYLAGALLDVLNSAEGRALLDTLMNEQKASRTWTPSYVIEEQEL